MEGLRRAEAFYNVNLPSGMARYVGCGWRHFTDAEAEFCFEREVKGKRECVSIVFYLKDLTGSEEDLNQALNATLDPSFDDYQPAKRDYGWSEGGRGNSGPRAWGRKN